MGGHKLGRGGGRAEQGKMEGEWVRAVGREGCERVLGVPAVTLQVSLAKSNGFTSAKAEVERWFPSGQFMPLCFFSGWFIWA